MNDPLLHRLQEREQAQQLRVLNPDSAQWDFSSNDYLGLARNEELANQIEVEYKKLPISLGSGGSRLLSGDSNYFQRLEKKLAAAHLAESALLMNSGYVANMSVFSSIPQKGDTVIYDELIHACIKDGVRLSHAKHYSFKHNDLLSLRNKLMRAEGEIYVAVESYYSMDGDEAPLVELATLCKEFNAKLIVDEAHSTGIVGEGGGGLCCELGIQNKVFLRIHTFGKGIGAHGACVVGSKTVRDYLINFARPFIYTTAMPLHGLVTINCAYDYIFDHPELQVSLKNKIQLFHHGIQPSIMSNSAIQVIIIPGNELVKTKAKELQKVGFDVRPVMSPTVKKGTERLRICLHVHNTDEQIVNLSKALNS